jgi:hypothetical protein
LSATRSRRYAFYSTNMLTGLASEFLPEFADFRAILAEIRNCLGLTQTKHGPVCDAGSRCVCQLKPSNAAVRPLNCSHRPIAAPNKIVWLFSDWFTEARNEPFEICFRPPFARSSPRWFAPYRIGTPWHSLVFPKCQSSEPVRSVYPCDSSHRP